MGNLNCEALSISLVFKNDVLFDTEHMWYNYIINSKGEKEIHEYKHNWDDHR